MHSTRYPTMSKTLGNFKLRVVEGEFTDSQIILMLGENGTGKTTFIRMLILQLPRDKRVGIPGKERIRKVEILLESSLMKLDDALMIFHDF